MSDREIKRREQLQMQWFRRLLWVAVTLLAVVLIAERLHLFHWEEYTNADFGIEDYDCQADGDGDGVDDQRDILAGVRSYIATKPKYKSVYYDGGYPTDGYGVCTDVVAQGFLAAGYDLQELVDQDIRNAPDAYDVHTPDKNIDFRRVRNLKVFFERNAIVLTNDVSDIAQWQGGDIVIFSPSHIGIVSDKRNRDGVPLLIHHGSPMQLGYEQDAMVGSGEIIGHYRWR